MAFRLALIVAVAMSANASIASPFHREAYHKPMAGGNIPSGWGQIFIQAGRQYGIPPAVLAGVSSVESNLGRNMGPSSAGAVGPMQFLPSTARGLGVNPYDVRSAIFGTAKYLSQLGYAQNALRALGAYNGGPGNPQYSYANQVMAEAARLRGQLGGGGPLAQPSGGGGGTTSIPVTTTSFDQAGYKQAQQRQLLAQFVSQKSPWDIPVKGAQDFGGPNPLFASGLLSKQAPNPSDFQHSQTTLHQIATGALQGMSGQSLVNVHNGAKGYVSPIPGAVIGRTDQGVDASMRPGSPIRALGDSRVVQIVSWYKGQPLVLMQLTSGSHAGQYWYVAEQIAPNVRVGQSVRAGQVIGTYASSGTGLELGWGSPSTPHLTLATAPGHGGYTEGQVTPEGSNFRSFLGSL